MRTPPGRERLVYSAEGTDAFLNLGMALRCSPENRHVRVIFSPKRSETGKEEQVFGQFNNTSTDCVKFYIHTVGKTRKTLLKCRELHKDEYKLCVYAFKGESIRRLCPRMADFFPFWRRVTGPSLET